MVNTTDTARSLLRPDSVDALLVGPVLTQSVAGQVMRLVTIEARELRVPKVTQDPTASWVNEGQEIAPSDAVVDEIVVRPAKVAGLSIITSELANDTSPEASQVIGDGLARDIARKIDQALFSSQPAPAPAGLANLTGANGVTTVDAGSGWTSLDAFTAASFEAASRNAIIGSWVANPQDAKALATLKESSTSQRALLQPDPTAPSRSILGGLQLLVSTAVEPGTVWGIDATRALLVVREEVQIEVDRSVYFTSDRVAVRATMRVGFGWPQPTALVKVALSA